MTVATFNPTIDSYINAIAPDTNGGGAGVVDIGLFFAGGSKAVYTRSVLDFDVSSLAGLYSSIDAAQLELYINAYQGGGAAATLYRCKRETSPYTELGVTWNKYDGVNAWTTGGGDYDSTTPTPVGFSLPAATGPFTITGLVNFITDGITTRSSIVSLLARCDDEANDGINRRIVPFSREDATHPPVLRVTYTPSGPPPGADRRRGRWP